MRQIIGLRTQLKPGMEEAYDLAHAQVWPELVTIQRELGLEHWTIFRRGVDLFHVVECDDFDRAIEALRDDPIDQRWQAEMSKYVMPAQGGRGAAVDRLRLVYRR